MGPDVQTLFNRYQGRFSPITVAMIFHLAVLALESLHSKDLIHTDLKPSKFVIGNGSQSDKLYLLGLELSERISLTKLSRSKSGTPRRFRMNENMFSSLNVHTGEGFLLERE